MTIATQTRASKASKPINAVVRALDTNKASDILTIDLTGKSSMADAMIIATGTSARHVSALAEYAIEALKSAGLTDYSVEGKEQGDWVLVDGYDVIVHIFRPEVRSIYNLEKMWGVPASTEMEYA